MERVTGFGLRIATAIAIPGAIMGDPAAPVDVAITLTKEPPADDVLEGSAEPHGPYQLISGGLRFICPKVGTYDIGTDHITVRPFPDSRADEVSAMLVATALPALLWMRGHYMLHAGAALLPNGREAIVIAGHSGSGKSSILAQIITRGGALVADDSIALDSHLSHRQVSGLPGGYFLPTSADQRTFHSIASYQSLSHASIGAILILDNRTENDAQITRIPPREAVELLLLHRHRPRVCGVIGNMTEMLGTTTAIAAQIPAYRWNRKLGAADLTPAEWDVLNSLSTNGALHDAD